MKPSLRLAALAAALLLVSLFSSSFAEGSSSSSSSGSEEATFCAAGAQQAAAESSSSEASSCGAFFDAGAPLSPAEVAAITAGALPAQARAEADSWTPFNATVPCPATVIIGSGIDAARVEAQLSACLNSMRSDPDRYSSSYPCSYSSWRSSAISPKRQPLVISGSGSNILNTAARAHSTEMATKNYFSHNSADGTTPSSRITNQFGYPSTYVGENIAAGQQTVLSVSAAWMCSSAHRTNILRCAFDTLGSGVAVNTASSKYGIYWTNDFGCSKSGGGCDSCGASPPQPPSPTPSPPSPATTPMPTQPPLPPPPATTTPPATTKPPAPLPLPSPSLPPPPPNTPAPTAPPQTTPPPTSPPPPAGSPVTKFSGSTSSGDGTWWRPIASGSALAGPIGSNVKFQAVRFSPSATGDYGLVVSAGPPATSAYAGEPWDNYCFVYSTASFDPKKQLVDLLRGNDDFGTDGSPGKCGFTGLSLAVGKTYTLVVSSYSRAGEGSWDAEVVSGPGGVVIEKQQQPKASSSAAQAAAAPVPAPLPVAAAAAAAAPASAPAAATSATPAASASATGGGVSSQRWDWVAVESASASAESDSSANEAELAEMFAEGEVERQKKEKGFEEEEEDN